MGQTRLFFSLATSGDGEPERITTLFSLPVLGPTGVPYNISCTKVEVEESEIVHVPHCRVELTHILLCLNVIPCNKSPQKYAAVQINFTFSSRAADGDTCGLLRYLDPSVTPTSIHQQSTDLLMLVVKVQSLGIKSLRIQRHISLHSLARDEQH